MQGLQALDQFKSFVSKIGGLGRYEDTYIVHAAEGETVVPMEVLDKNPLLKKRLFKTMMEMGIEPGRYIVGNELNSKNPVTGQPEFFLKQIGRRLRKAAADISGYAAPIAGAMFGPAAGAATGALLGQYKRENPGDPTQGLNMALRGGLAGIGTNIAGGQTGLNTIFGRGLAEKGISLRDIFSPGGSQQLKDFLNVGDDKKSFARQYLEGFFKDKPIEESLLQETAETLNIDTKDKAKMKFLEKLIKDKQKGKFGNLSLGKLASLYGLGTAGLGFLIDKTSSDGPVGMTRDEMPEGTVSQGIVNPIGVFPGLQTRADGGIMDLQDGGESVGPGTGTSDSIPAMLSDGEFVMTAKAVRGAGGGDRREGARKMYQAMDKLEARA
jgi:hypothetical protein